ncbi:hypothetical protein [Noviherbaspirillum sp.]|uniref:hypothetical protein n=1 Tax=Noviherbaspirillum sp. TaxID=1926288 RepID=UPI002FE1132E
MQHGFGEVSESCWEFCKNVLGTQIREHLYAKQTESVQTETAQGLTNIVLASVAMHRSKINPVFYLCLPCAGLQATSIFQCGKGLKALGARR